MKNKKTYVHVLTVGIQTGIRFLPSNTHQSAFLPFQVKLFLSQIETSVKKKEVPTALLLDSHGCNGVRLSQATELSLKKKQSFFFHLFKEKGHLGEENTDARILPELIIRIRHGFKDNIRITTMKCRQMESKDRDMDWRTLIRMNHKIWM